MNTTESVLDHHLETFGEQDIEGIMEDYTDESVVVTNMGTFRGLEEIEGLFENLFSEFSAPEASITMDQQLVEGEFGYIVWHAETPENVYEFATDTFYIPDEAIEFQTFAGKLSPKA
ncbi:nuclear transport factor 2 family protein [Halalkalicoccus sp. NIPERK01]|uniref:nuclear transport factor 2 family protein n=1 Tax=Halalkalicoccus sp. NIPERK01 TaxID=3053469 RepID=UPI00256EFBB4|nr:nuclear transport factor 2 family protein [Halalkalicoccus sp. NIPERK01]MDL5361118.1 nuclear transport factor 2 family protein [Halalkalicoccus sp. NIPERK01]